MKRFFSIVFVVLYLYNLVGYLLLFAWMQGHVKDDVKRMLMGTVPDSELVVLSFHTSSLEQGRYDFKWIEDYEFRYAGRMYDVVRSHTSNDSTYFNCINDVLEERLFANLEDHVQRHMGDPDTQGKLDLFKDVFKDSFPHQVLYMGSLTMTGALAFTNPVNYLSIDLEVPFLPPRTSSNA